MKSRTSWLKWPKETAKEERDKEMGPVQVVVTTSGKKDAESETDENEDSKLKNGSQPGQVYNK